MELDLLFHPLEKFRGIPLLGGKCKPAWLRTWMKRKTPNPAGRGWDLGGDYKGCQATWFKVADWEWKWLLHWSYQSC